MFKWKSDYNIGIEEIDSQHQKFFELAHALLEVSKSVDDAYDPDALLDVIEEFCQYTIYHFETEKKYFDKYDFPCESHDAEHEKFIDFLANLNIDDIEHHSSASLFKLMKFVDGWIKNQRSCSCWLLALMEIRP
jgi:hemerythrin